MVAKAFFLAKSWTKVLSNLSEDLFFFFGLYLIMGRKTDFVSGWKIFILVFISLKFVEFPGPPLLKILRTLLMTCSSYVQFLMFASSTSFSKKAASLLKIASRLWYLKEDLRLHGLFDSNIGLTTKCTMVKVSENVEENEPLSQARVDLTNTKTKHLLSVSPNTVESCYV